MELFPLHQHLAPVTMERNVFKKALAIFSRSARNEVPRQRGVSKSLSRGADVPDTASVPQRLLSTFSERGSESA